MNQLSDLRAILAELTKQRELDESIGFAAKAEDNARIQARKKAEIAVMEAIAEAVSCISMRHKALEQSCMHGISPYQQYMGEEYKLPDV